MSASLINKILENKQSVREIIDEAVVSREVSEDIGGFNNQIKNSRGQQGKTNRPFIPNTEETPDETETTSDENANEYRHLFVRRWHEDDEKPYKRAKVASADEALNLFFEWVLKYKQDKVEIWSDVSSDAKNFYRFCVKNREMLESLWKNSLRMKKTGAWPGTFRDLQARSRQSGSNLVGTLYPFEVQ